MMVTQLKTKIGDSVATATKTRPSTKAVSFSQLRELSARRRRSSYPTDAKVERQYWLRQIQILLGEDL
jgi:hypothetical protein